MTYRIIIEPTAEREIRSAVRWKTENASPTVAARWYNGLIQKIDTLRRRPTRCPLAAEDDKFDEEIRELLYGRGGKRVTSSPHPIHDPGRYGPHPLCPSHRP